MHGHSKWPCYPACHYFPKHRHTHTAYIYLADASHFLFNPKLSALLPKAPNDRAHKWD